MIDKPSIKPGSGSSLACPACQAPLHPENQQKRWQCENQHSFDRARQGHLNLLLAHKKRSKDPGDDQAMVDARTRLLDSGVYQPISDALNQQTLKLLQTGSQSATSPVQISDIGCGEGYYSQRLNQFLSAENVAHQLYGIDISKQAVQAAARRDKQVRHQQLLSKETQNQPAFWLVASGAQPPLLPASQDIITCLFTRLMPQGMTQVLKPGGHVITINTGANHLRQMREILYPEVREQILQPQALMAEHDLVCIDEQNVRFGIQLSSRQQRLDLLAMTPHQWKASESARQAWADCSDELAVDIDVVIHSFCYQPTEKTHNSTEREA